MKEVATIQRDWRASTENMLALLSELASEKADLLPAPGRWSLLETLEHLVALEQALGFIFRGRKAITERHPEENIESIRSVFGNDQKKLNAYGPLIPQGKFRKKEEALVAFRENREQLIRYAEQAGWDSLCLDFEHGLFGRLTVREWIYFCIFHGDRHRRQMVRSVEEIGKKERTN